MARKQFQRRKFGHIEALDSGESPQGHSMTVVLFHGYGADMNDLAPLADAVRAPENTRWIFPNGPQRVPIGPHQEGRAWFPISISQLESAMSGGAALDFSAIVPPGMKKAREAAHEMLSELCKSESVANSRLVIGGFSQGAMLSTDVMMHARGGQNWAASGLVLLSGTLVCREQWQEVAPRFKGFSFFQSHGVNDMVLPYQAARQLNEVLVTAGWQGALHTFGGGHDIPPEILIRLGDYLRVVHQAPRATPRAEPHS
jgi:phospholipase/carboxylesterase